MSKTISRILAMSAFLGGVGGIDCSRLTVKGGYQGSKKTLSFEKRKKSFDAEIKFHNETKCKDFPMWNTYQISNIPILAYNEKNAHKIFDKILKSNGLFINEILSDEQTNTQAIK